MHDVEAQGPLSTLLRERIDEQSVVTLSVDATPSVVWVTAESGGDVPRRTCVSGAMKILQVGTRYVAAGVIDPPGSVRAVELQLDGSERLDAAVRAEGWLLVLPPGAGDQDQRATFTYQTGETVESETLPPAAASIDSGGTGYAPI